MIVRMFQDFDPPQPSGHAEQKLTRLRDLMRQYKIDAYLIPRADCHQGEYVPEAAERLNWLTGFSGSAGMAVVSLKNAAIFVDGRYTVQARTQVDTRRFDVIPSADTPPAKWLVTKLENSATIIGFDPWLHTPFEINRYRTALAPKGIKLKPVARKNLIDAAWGKDRPAEPAAKAFIHPLKFAGHAAKKKLKDIQTTLKSAGHDAAILTLPDSIAWLLNIRGADIPHTPVTLCFAIVHARGKTDVFVNPEKLDRPVRAHLEKVARIHPPNALNAALRELKDSGARVRIDPKTSACWFELRLKKSQIIHAQDPCIIPKAIKNPVEIAGSRAAHERDGVAITKFLAWLSKNAPTGKVTEIAAARKLEDFRAQTGELREISFDTISGAGPNGAIVHYRVTGDTNRNLKRGELYLVDSGAQYHDGTTDITRTLAVGKPSNEMRARFTQVLKGHIAIATARFPQGARGVDLDPFARRALWQAGVDYDHGTGHGVGSYLSVHEGPASISKAGMVPLQPGMILSNEPGFYAESHYGIRIENLVLVNEPEIPKGGTRPMLSFETLTLAPIDRTLIDPSQLETSERHWLNDYHTQVFKTLSPGLDRETRSWLKQATSPV